MWPGWLSSSASLQLPAPRLPRTGLSSLLASCALLLERDLDLRRGPGLTSVAVGIPAFLVEGNWGTIRCSSLNLTDSRLPGGSSWEEPTYGTPLAGIAPGLAISWRCWKGSLELFAPATKSTGVPWLLVEGAWVSAHGRLETAAVSLGFGSVCCLAASELASAVAWTYWCGSTTLMLMSRL